MKYTLTWAVNPSSKASQVPCATPGWHRRNQSYELNQEASTQARSGWVIVQYGLGRLWVDFAQATLHMKMKNRKNASVRGRGKEGELGGERKGRTRHNKNPLKPF